MNNITIEQESVQRPKPRKANECVVDTGQFCQPAMLFDEFWREGELALFFGAAGTGKSVLAVQIADALARGRGLEGFQMPTGRRKVLYVDLVLRDSQFQRRYTHFPSNSSQAKRYKFAENLYRDRPQANDELCEWLRGMVRENGFQVVIIDDLSALKSTHDGTRETLSAMRRLKQIGEELHISILVLTDAEEPGRSGIASGHDLRRSRVLCSAADSVFAIGKSRHSPDIRYLIQTRSRSASIVWNERNAPTARLMRMDSGLLGFQFDERFTPDVDEETRRLICRVRSMHDSGETYRAVAKELNISKSQAARLYKQWTPKLERTENKLDQYTHLPEQIIDPEDAWEPKEEAYRGEHTDQYLISRGMPPVWWEQLEAEQNADEPQTEHASESTPPVTAAGSLSASESAPPPAATAFPDPDSAEKSFTTDHPPLTARLDGYGREIFVESEDTNGKPMVWYQFDKKGTKSRFVRTFSGINIDRLTTAAHR